MRSAALIKKENESYSDYEKRLLTAHWDFFGQNNIVDGLEVWNEYAPFYFRSKMKDGAHDFSKPSMISAFMPKSGGTFLHNRMIIDFHYKDFWWGLTDPRSPVDVFASRRGAELYCLGGFTCHTHFLPRPQPLQVLGEIYHERIWIHIRNPIDCVVASFYHYNGKSQGTGADLNARLATIDEQIRKYNLDLNDLNDFAVKNIGFFIWWLKEWQQFMSCNPDKVFVTFFDELNAPEILFRRLFSEYAYKGAVNAITSTFANDRRRDSDEVRQNLAPRIAMQLKDRVAIELRDFVHLDRLMG